MSSAKGLGQDFLESFSRCVWGLGSKDCVCIFVIGERDFLIPSSTGTSRGDDLGVFSVVLLGTRSPVREKRTSAWEDECCCIFCRRIYRNTGHFLRNGGLLSGSLGHILVHHVLRPPHCSDVC